MNFDDYGFSLPYRCGNGTDQYGPGTVTKKRTKNRTGEAVPKQYLEKKCLVLCQNSLFHRSKPSFSEGLDKKNVCCPLLAGAAAFPI